MPLLQEKQPKILYMLPIIESNADMQTTHINHLDTHAIIGGGEVHKFTANQDAEFFEILSSTLYSNKKLAAVREILCNAWDANIEAGNENPVEVTINSKEMIFKDSGPGISKDDMPAIYCSYGGSTKRDNKNVTGGFGLGSKAPFAVSKNFSVTSCHGGVKTIYNISRGTAATDGIPDLRVMVSVPTTDTGITVTIPINSADQNEYSSLVKDLAFLGGILVRLNGLIQKRINYSKVIGSVVYLPNSHFPSHLPVSTRMRQPRCFVKYGAVVYPIPEEFSVNQKLVSGGSTPIYRNTAISPIFIAPPGSIGITPSRETLSMTDLTKQTLTGLFRAASQQAEALRPEVIEGLLPYYMNIEVDLLEHASANGDRLFKFLRDPLQGLVQYVKDMRYHVQSKLPQYRLKIVSQPSSLKELMMHEYASNGYAEKDIAQALRATDPDGKKINALLMNQIKKDYPLYGDYIIKKLMTGQTLGLSMKVVMSKYLKFTQRMLKHLENLPGVQASISYKRWERIDISSYEMSLKSFGYGRYIFDKLFEQPAVSNIRQIRILVAQSNVSIKRVFKEKPSLESSSFIQIVARKKNNLEKVKKLLSDWGFENIIPIYDLDVLPKPIPQNEKLFLYHADDKQHFSRKHNLEKVTHYMFVPASYLIPNILGVKLNQRKINIEPKLGQMLSYLFPNLVLVPGLAEAAELEKAGLKNVLYTIAEEVIEYFNDSRNHEVLLANLKNVSGYFRSYQLDTVMQVLTPAMMMEALGKKPTYIGNSKTIPVLIHVFFELLRLNHAPKYGFQHIHRAATKTQKIFDSFFGNEAKAIVEDNIFQGFLNHLPSKYDGLAEDQKPIFSAALMAAIQTTRLHQKLSKRR